jgi:hypothetical protein
LKIIDGLFSFSCVFGFGSKYIQRPLSLIIEQNCNCSSPVTVLISQNCLQTYISFGILKNVVDEMFLQFLQFTQITVGLLEM